MERDARIVGDELLGCWNRVCVHIEHMQSPVRRERTEHPTGMAAATESASTMTPCGSGLTRCATHSLRSAGVCVPAAWRLGRKPVCFMSAALTSRCLLWNETPFIAMAFRIDASEENVIQPQPLQLPSLCVRSRGTPVGHVDAQWCSAAQQSAEGRRSAGSQRSTGSQPSSRAQPVNHGSRCVRDAPTISPASAKSSLSPSSVVIAGRYLMKISKPSSSPVAP